MGEIKSTLDIIMEKTKGLTLTDEEKKSLEEQDLAGKVKGLVQRYLGGGLTHERLAEEVAHLAGQGKDLAMVRRFLTDESIHRIRLGEDNEAVLKILGTLPDIEIVRLKVVLSDFQNRFLVRRETQEQRLLSRLKEKGISGSAVVPNLEADPEWAHLRAKMEEELKAALRSIMS